MRPPIEDHGVNVLAFDCAGRGCAAALVADRRIAARRSQPMERGQAEALLPLIAATLEDAGIGMGELDLLAVTIGPGGFTGLRIGLAAARGLALATGLPLIGVTGFDAIAAAVPSSQRAGQPLVVALDSKRDEVFVQCFAADGPALADGALVTPDQANALVPPGPILLAGDAAAMLAPWLGDRAVIAPEAARPDPAIIALLALERWRPGERPAPPRPLYLRAPDTTEPRRAGAVT
jgi:tRNA threonylcarbamoyladenosine biosynthesis protein TsaB